MSTTSTDIIPETIDDALAKWDAGEPVFTVEMGGLGPGYEQVIHILAFELMRELRGFDWTNESKENRDAILAKRDEVVDRLNPKCQFSGAQVGAATNLAGVVIRRGYRVAMRDPEVSDRLILVSRNFPAAA